MTTNKTQHTPGPWEIGKANMQGWYMIWSVSGKSVALLIGGGDPTVRKANARLFAAAPELKKIVFELNDFLKFLARGNPAQDGFLMPVLKDIDALLAKIEGE
jgi:hypothetical protein